MSVVFDKLSFMRHIESEGTFARSHADKLSDAFHQAVSETVATKAGFARLEARIDNMGARVDAKLAGVDAKLAGRDAKLAKPEATFDSSVATMSASVANMKVWTVRVGVGVAPCSALSAIRFLGH